MSEREIFMAVLDLPDTASRGEYLDKVCEGDAGRRARIDALVAAHDTADSFLGNPAVQPAELACNLTVDVDSKASLDSKSASDGENDDDDALNFLQPSTRPDSLGRLAHYEILQVLGKGGFGIVFRAFDDVLQRVVAIKVLNAQIAATSPARKRFLREARSSAKVRHENVVQVYEVVEQPLPYLVMEFIPGETLQQRLDRSGPLEAPEVVHIGRQIAEALAAAHAQGLVHRDIKPGNVLLESGVNPRVKITDFGLARAADDASMTQSGMILGTPLYMAPEQAHGNKLDHRADLFSLGSVLYTMSSGRPPFRASSTLAVLTRVANDTPRPIPEIIPEVPQWLCDIITKLHAKNPEDRFQTAREVADLLAHCEAKLKAKEEIKYSLTASAVNSVAQSTSAAKPTVVAKPAPVTKPATPVKPAPNAPRVLVAAPRRKRWQTAAAIVLLCLFVLGVTEFAGMTHLFRAQQAAATIGATQPVTDSTPVVTWGEVTDPLRDCRFTEENGQLTIAVPGDRFHDLNPLPGRNLNSPRVLREVAGDFEARVTVLPFPRPTSLYSTGPNPPYVGAGLVVWSEETDILRLFRAETNGSFVQAEWYNGLALGGQKWIPVPDGPTHLRIRRTGETLRLASSADGQTWTEVETVANLQPASRVRVGVGVVNAVKQEFKVQFDGFEIKELPPSSLPATFKNSIGMEFVIVPKGKSWLGGGKDKLGDKEVEIPADFYLGKYDVTQEEWEKVMGENPSSFSRLNYNRDAVKDIKDEDLRRFPVESVSWMDCQSFVKKLNTVEKQTGWVYRLPTGAEWEYACRGGTMADKQDSAFDFYFAKPTNTLLPDQANFGKGLNRPCKVGSYAPNALGLFDMHGNVAEWIADDLGAWKRSFRGGSWFDDAGRCKASFGAGLTMASNANACYGLRLALIPAGKGGEQPNVAKPEALPATFTNSIGMEFVIVPKGKSWLGGGKDKLGDKEVEIPADFYLGKYDVTQEEWEKVMGENPSYFSRTGNGRDAVKDIPDADLKRFPVECVSRDQDQIFVAKLNALDKPTGWVYRLPKEAEWEYACRNGPMADKLDSAFDFYFAKPTNTLLPEQANFDNGLKRTCKVGSYEPNKLGLYDMHGNVWQVCDDTEIAPDGASLRGAARGGGWGFGGVCGATCRGTAPTPTRNRWSGLRLALVPAAEGGDPAAVANAETPHAAIGPFTDADIQRIAALPADKQVEEVRKALMKLNLKFDGKVTHEIEAGIVTKLKFNGKVNDLSPLRALTGLKAFACDYNGGELSDVSPLKDMKLTELALIRTGVSDLSPLKNMKLTSLDLYVTPVSDLSPLKDMPLTKLDLSMTRVSDLSPLKDMKLTFLHCDNTGVTDLQPLKDMKLTEFFCSAAAIKDLSVLTGMPLTKLRIYETGVTDLSPLKDMQLEEICLTPKNIAKGLSILRDMKSLKTIGIGPMPNQIWPAAEFWTRYDEGEFGISDAWIKRAAALPAAEQVEAVRKALMKLNPGFDGTVGHKIENGVVTEFRIVTDKVTDIAPIRVFNALRMIECHGTWTNKRNGLLADLTPLEGMNLAGLTHLDLSNTNVTDTGMACFKDCKNLTFLSLGSTRLSDAGLIHFKGCRKLTELHLWDLPTVGDAGLIQFKDCSALTRLNLARTKVSGTGLAYFKDCKSLTFLHLDGTQVDDTSLARFKDCMSLTDLNVSQTRVSDTGLTNFKGMRLKNLSIDNTGVTDLNSLRGMPLEKIYLTPKNVAGGLNVLRDMQSLKTIGIGWNQAWPAAEFWTRYDDGEFGITDAWIKRIAALRAVQQADEVRKAMIKLNPGFDGKFTLSIENGVVTELNITSKAVTDLSPVRALAGLRVLRCVKGQLADLSPLKGMTITSLDLNGCTQVRDLEPLKDMPLENLNINGTNVTDLSALKSMSLKTIQCGYNAKRDAEILRSIKTLETINGKPKAEVLNGGAAPADQF